MTDDAQAPAIETLDPAFAEVVAPDAKVRTLAEDLRFAEGPAWLEWEGGFLVFSDIPADRLYRFTEGKPREVFREPSHHANGNAVEAEGRLVTCHHGSRRVTRTTPEGEVTTLCSTYQGKKLNSPNDVAVRRDGTIWFTDPPYGIKENERELEKNYVFRLAPGADEPVVVADDFERPNGLCFSPDESLLYIADSDHGRSEIRVFRVTPKAVLEAGRPFAKIDPPAPDGIRCDAAGRLYVTAGDGVHVYDAEGKLLGKVRLAERPTNCEFGGAKRTTLYVTARTKLYAIEMKAKGVRH